MNHRYRLFLIAASAAAVMLLAVGTASARRLEASAGNIQVVWSTLIASDAASVNISCPVTISGSFHSRTISKVSGALVGYINRALIGTAGACTGGQARMLTETLPWHIQYNSFAGTLPNITSVTFVFVGVRLQFVAEGVTCLAGTTQANPAFGQTVLSRGTIVGFRVLEEHTIPLGGEFACSFASPGKIAGTGTLTVAERTTAVTVRLVQ